MSVLDRLTVYDSEEAWLAATADSIGGRRAAAICGHDRYVSPLRVWAEMRGLLDRYRPESIAMRIGRRYEYLVCDLWEEEVGQPVDRLGERSIVTADNLPRQHASLDGRTELEGRPAIFEAKVLDRMARDQWEEGPPAHVVAQVQHYMAVSGYGRAVVAVIFGNKEFSWWQVDRDPGAIAEMQLTIRRFLECVDSGERPDLDGHDDTRAVLEALHPTEECHTTGTPTIVTLPPEAMDWTDAYAGLADVIREAKAKQEEVKNRLRAEIGDAAYGALADGTFWSWKSQERKERLVAASSSRVLRKVKRVT